MARKGFYRRLLAALADATPAFTPEPVYTKENLVHRLLAALTDATPAFQTGHNTDQYSARSPNPPTETDPLHDATDTPAAVHQISARSSDPLRETDLPGDVTDALTAFAQALAARPPEQRLAARAKLPTAELTMTRRLAYLRLVTQEFRQDLDLALDLARDLDRDLDRALDLARDHDLARDRARARAHAHDLARDLAHAHDLALDLAHAHAHARVLALARDRALAHDLARALVRVRASDLDVHFDFLLRGLGDDSLKIDQLLRDVTSMDMSRLIAAVDAIQNAVTDLTNADLRAVDLSGVALEGLRWSRRTTRWPEQWRSYVEANSVPVGPDLYEIRPGASTPADEDILIKPRT